MRKKDTRKEGELSQAFRALLRHPKLAGTTSLPPETGRSMRAYIGDALCLAIAAPIAAASSSHSSLPLGVS